MTVDSQVVSSIGKGILVLAAIGPDDTPKTVETMANRITKMRLWPDATDAQWKQNVSDIDGEILCVSQFTLYASTRKGNKPDFHAAAKPDIAKDLYDLFLTKVQQAYKAERVKDGVFQAMMQVALVNDGPVTLEMNTDVSKKGNITAGSALSSTVPSSANSVSDLSGQTL